MNRKIAVVGGGAAGMMAAIQAAKAGARTDLYEKNDRVGKKLLATGNGKCNFSNRNMNRDAYYGSAVSFYEKLFPHSFFNTYNILFIQIKNRLVFNMKH